MGHLFAEQFVVPLIGEPPHAAEVHYDEELALNVLRDGSPFIELGRGADTATFTEVRGEAEDTDRDDENAAPSLATITKVNSEGEDFARDVSLATNTVTRVRDEPDDEDRAARAEDGLYRLDTMTKTEVRTEADDADHDARGEDGFGRLDTMTKTAVATEADDADRDARADEARGSLDTSTMTLVDGEAGDDDQDPAPAWSSASSLRSEGRGAGGPSGRLVRVVS